MFAGFGPTELIIVLVIVLLIFGPKRLPGLGKQLGSGMREFKESITSKDHDDDDDEADAGERQPATAQLERPAGEPVPPSAAARTPSTTAPSAEADAARERSPQS